MDFLLIHISDLHINASNTRRSTARMADLADAIRRSLRLYAVGIHRKILLITGDIIDTPSQENHQLASQLLRDIKIALEIEAILLVPGNHDARALGIGPLNYRDFVRYSNASDSYFDTDLSLAIVGFDSSDGLAARGYVDRTQYKSAIRTFDDMKDDASDASLPQSQLFKIALVHHHPLPIAEGEARSIHEKFAKTKAEPLMQMSNAGAFLDACLRHEFDLILHGHRHVSKVHRYSSIVDSEWRELLVVSSPSSTGLADELRPGFNLIVKREELPMGEIIRLKFSPSDWGPAGEVILEDQDPGINLLVQTQPLLHLDLSRNYASAFYYAQGPDQEAVQISALKGLIDSIERTASKKSIAIEEFLLTTSTIYHLWDGPIGTASIIRGFRPSGSDITRIMLPLLFEAYHERAFEVQSTLTLKGFTTVQQIAAEISTKFPAKTEAVPEVLIKKFAIAVRGLVSYERD